MTGAQQAAGFSEQASEQFLPCAWCSVIPFLSFSLQLSPLVFRGLVVSILLYLWNGVTSGMTILRKKHPHFAEEPRKSQQREALMPGMQGWAQSGSPDCCTVCRGCCTGCVPTPVSPREAAMDPHCVTVPAAAKAGLGTAGSTDTPSQQGLTSRRAPSAGHSTSPQHFTWSGGSKAWQQHARGNSGQKRGTQAVGGTFPVPANKNKPSKGLGIGIQATHKAGTSKLEHIPNISLEVQLIECFQ